MPRIKRRQFLQFASSAIAAISLDSCKIRQQQRLLDGFLYRGGQSSPRKLALLVGINAYPRNSGLPALKGCLTDVELQRHLLIYRLGFNPKDILTLTNTQATRKGILEAFEEHLIKQAKPEDVVVFHYSGHGSQVASNAVGVTYHRLHHFLTEAPWSAMQVNQRRLQVMNQCTQTQLSKGFTLIVDDSGRRKSGNFTAGVGRQYIGEIWKTEALRLLSKHLARAGCVGFRSFLFLSRTKTNISFNLG